MFIKYHLFDPYNGILGKGILEINKLFVDTDLMQRAGALLLDKVFIRGFTANTTHQLLVIVVVTPTLR